MGVTVFAGLEPGPDRIHFHNGFAWFLDTVFGGKELPDHFFGQGAGEGPESPGPIDAETATRFGEAIEHMDVADLDKRLHETMAEHWPKQYDPADEMSDAIETIEDIARLARMGRGLIAR
jgi:hypothetical protein